MNNAFKRCNNWPSHEASGRSDQLVNSGYLAASVAAQQHHVSMLLNRADDQ